MGYHSREPGYKLPADCVRPPIRQDPGPRQARGLAATLIGHLPFRVAVGARPAHLLAHQQYHLDPSHRLGSNLCLEGGLILQEASGGMGSTNQHRRRRYGAQLRGAGSPRPERTDGRHAGGGVPPLTPGLTISSSVWARRRDLL